MKAYSLTYETDHQRNHYLAFIVKSLHMKIDVFMENVIHSHYCYEMLIYRWSIKLFEKGVPQERALEIIKKARILVFLRNYNLHNMLYGTVLHCKKILQMLDQEPLYAQLPAEEKQSIRLRIIALYERDAPVSEIEQELTTFKPPDHSDKNIKQNPKWFFRWWINIKTYLLSE